MFQGNASVRAFACRIHLAVEGINQMRPESISL